MNEDQRRGGQRLLPAREQRQRLQPLARRLGVDLEARFERIVGIDQRQMRLTALEQAGEKGRQQLDALQSSPTSLCQFSN
ncbi:hypothetical protein [Mycobacterium tuberculosis]|uniref:hypothetical protein n=1 Tax=Mycobacterium tuberculosis TaxID=1773 RepID=UPI00272D1505|nr:hypothetical protein [Mycobacterium tuberculosis]